jgi:beta-N-acetylhexosaminidase
VRYRVPSRPRERRRLATLLSACLAALVTGAALGSRADEGSAPRSSQASARSAEAPDPVDGLSLRQQVGQLVILRFDGGTRPTYVQEAFKKGEAAGVILFGDNVASGSQLRNLTRSLQDAAGGSALVSTDQEGGSIRNVPFAPPEASPATISRPRLAQRLARETAEGIGDLGVNVNLAPVADVASIEGSVVAGRAYPGDAEQVAELVQAAIDGYGTGGVASTAKHFPGIGAATLNTDDTAVTIERTRRELEQVELVPFRGAVDSDVPLVMAGHALYPAVDRRRIASQSPAILQDLLRDELGYDGVIVTDSMEAEAVLSRSPTPEASVASIEAGADLLLTTSTGSYFPVFRQLMREARRNDDFRARVAESAARVLGLKEEMGLEPPPGS